MNTKLLSVRERRLERPSVLCGFADFLKLKMRTRILGGTVENNIIRNNIQMLDRQKNRVSSS